MKKQFAILMLLLSTVCAIQAQTLEWAKRMGGTDRDHSRSIALDVAGNIYITGYFEGTANFDPGTVEHNLTSVGNSDIFISKLDAEGNFVWAKRIGGPGYDSASSITLDNAGNIYTTGYFSDTVDFDPGDEEFNLTSIGQGIFITKLDTDGNFVWAKRMGGDNNQGNSIAVDMAGNVYTTDIFKVPQILTRVQKIIILLL